ncbi:cellulose binding domain-containing protein [Glycomyces luteolus]|uniref:Cellulose binding domain-containing protein n=1 Tax=Glycomyces luteolus TaxID=2670330 RepID=A0A9X3P7A1_9ACTN|nr:cellulose binding domain-containing protein [Glycomyces luteolus]MDA1358921.1 cellulose binding domain-containing protein [Glycomyces luteolus]
MGDAAGAHDDAPGGRGRLHGRLLQVLGGVSAVAALIALWQFGVFGEGPDRDPVDVIEGVETPSVPDGESESEGAASAGAASATVESPSESSAAATSAEPSSASPTPAAPSETASAATEAAAPASCTANLTLENAWDDSVEVTVEVVSTGSVASASWEIDLDLRDVEIYNHWAMRELEDGRYGSEDWNGRLDPEENAIAGFQATVGDHAELPDAVACTARA